MFILCNNEKTIAEVVQFLNQTSCVFLDCEGRDLGTRNGALSIISLGSLHSETIYLVDVVSLSPDLLQPVFDLLGNENLRKVVWDGRMDFSELFFGHATAIDANVLDLQLVDITSRAARGENEYKRNHRLCSGFPWREVRKLQLEDLHALCSLDRALREHDVANVAQKDVNVKKAHASNSTEIWMQRPLTDELLAYAAGDIERITALYEHFLKTGYLEDALLPDLLSQSARYVGFFRSIGRPSDENRFWRSALLPLGILQATGEELQVCGGCKRALSKACYPLPLQETNRNDQEDQLPYCRVCTFISAKFEFRARAVAIEEIAKNVVV
ncbi:hypothetical protein SCHPADRAFT_939514 [Schizopora paradoxa]|uniref:3'-5' exonuclease domain-containing protein n=1 Tax=Schizopora paradoxa TaxID=27342 RepID=A0A0H2RR69_9AGAM|nr:hypothetical protein SCHPADRAFT_939514 [Schizopora paradoxa]